MTSVSMCGTGADSTRSPPGRRAAATPQSDAVARPAGGDRAPPRPAPPSAPRPAPPPPPAMGDCTAVSTPIADYALLSDCHSAALVSRSGSVDWLCFPRFDSPAVFGRLLDPAAGHWSIAPVGEYQVTRRYLERTLVLETTFTTATGSVTWWTPWPWAATSGATSSAPAPRPPSSARSPGSTAPSSWPSSTPPGPNTA